MMLHDEWPIGRPGIRRLLKHYSLCTIDAAVMSITCERSPSKMAYVQRMKDETLPAHRFRAPGHISQQGGGSL